MHYDPSVIIEDCPHVYSVDQDSILLIESLDILTGEKVLEVGCGSGVVSIHCALAGAEVTAVDINPYAVDCTIGNAELNRVKIDVRLSDIYSAVDGIFDTIIFNLPYLPVEEEGWLEKAWTGGEDGIEPLRKLLDRAADYLSEEGSVVVVTSSLMDQCALEALLSEYNYEILRSLKLFFERLDVVRCWFKTPCNVDGIKL